MPTWLRNNKILVAILLAAFLIRVIGIGYGLPQKFVGDEFVQVAVALKMLDTKSLIPNFPDIFYHQPLSAYISTFGMGVYLLGQLASGRFDSLAEMRQYYSINSGELLIVPRFMSVVLAMAMVWLLYLIGRDLFNKRVGLLAALFGAVDFLLVFIQHSGRVWSYMPVFIALALWVSIKLFQKETTQSWLKSAGATLLAAANLLPGIFTFAPPLMARWSWRNKRMWIAIGVVALGVLIILLMNPRGLGALLFRFQSLSGGELVEKVTGAPIVYEVPPVPLSRRVFDTFITLFNYSPIFLILFFVGGRLLWREDRRKFWFLMSFPIVYYLFIGPFFTFGWVARALVPLAIYLVIFSAYAFDRLVAGKEFAFLATGVAIIPLVLGLMLDVKLLWPDTRTQAVEWIYQNLPEDSRILVYSLTNETVNQNREVLELIEKVTPQELDTRQRTLLAGNDFIYPRPKYFTWDLRDIGPEKLPEDFFQKNLFQYYVRTDWQNPVEEEFFENFSQRFKDKKLVARFSPFVPRESGSEIINEAYAHGLAEAEEFGGNNFNKHNILNLHNMIYPVRALFAAKTFGPVVEIYEVEFK